MAEPRFAGSIIIERYIIRFYCEGRLSGLSDTKIQSIKEDIQSGTRHGPLDVGQDVERRIVGWWYVTKPAQRIETHVIFGKEDVDYYNEEGIIPPLEELHGERKTRTFKTKEERNAYIHGLQDMQGWEEYLVLSDTTPQLDDWWRKLDIQTIFDIAELYPEEDETPVEFRLRCNLHWSNLYLKTKLKIYKLHTEPLSKKRTDD